MSRAILPVPGVGPRKVKSMSRQARYALRHVANGLCPRCGEENLAIKGNGKLASLGPKCLKAQREIMHSRLKCVRRNKNALSYQLAKSSGLAVAYTEVTAIPEATPTAPQPVQSAWQQPAAEDRLRDTMFSNKQLAEYYGVSEAAVRGRRQRIAKKDASRRQAA